MSLPICITNRRDRHRELAPTQFFVARPSPLGNPYRIGRHGNRLQVIAKYRRWLWTQIEAADPAVMGELEKILDAARHSEVDLECWCAPLPCHGEVVRSALNFLASAAR